MANVIIWRESVYRTGRCPECGEKVRDSDGMPAYNTLLDREKGWLYCPKCMRVIAKVRQDNRTEAEIRDKHNALHGYWDEGV